MTPDQPSRTSGSRATTPARPHWVRRRLLWPLRNLWRSLTSMRTALILLFLLALASIPGALLPQRDLNEGKTLEYIADRGALGEWMDRFQLFDVFSSAWFTAIYVLLFVSLVGCLTPRLIEYVQAMRAKPVAAPRNLKRLPRHQEFVVDGTPGEIAERVGSRLSGWRQTTTTRTADKTGTDSPQVVEVSAEKGYLREFGNLVFHFALLALLLSVALGKIYGYEGTRSLVADGQQGLCNTSTAVYDSFRAGSLVDGTDLSPFCIRVDDFKAEFLDTGQPANYEATVRYAEGTLPDSEDGWDTTSVRVNEPLRIAGDRVYVLGNGFAPTFTVTFPNGEKRTQTYPFVPDELQTMLSSGAMRFDTPAGMYPDEDVRRTQQIALEGLFAPTASYEGTLLTSASPEPTNPHVAIRIYRGDTGLDTGLPQSVYQLDLELIHQGRLSREAQVNLAQGQSHTLDDGTTVTFDGYERWVSVQVSHDPAQIWVLVSSLAMLGGLLISLLVRRRRLWARITVDPESTTPRVVVEIAGLARTDQSGWGEGFEEQAAALVDADPEGDKRRLRGL